MRIRFESDNELALNKILNVPACVIIARSVFEERDGKFYPQVYLNSCCLEQDHDDNSYAIQYGEYLFKKRIVNFVTTDFSSL